MHPEFCARAKNSINTNNSSLPIKIPIPSNKLNVCTDDLLSDQYSLNLNNFNPSKMSPPDDWKIRLQSRLNTYNDNSSDFSLNK